MSRSPSRRRVVGYLRVSTDRQAEEGLGLEVQADAIKAWAKANNARVVGTFADEGVSGSNGLDTRDALLDALNLIKASQAEGGAAEDEPRPVDDDDIVDADFEDLGNNKRK